ncbi:MAG: NADP-dependent phosphogluconate dehydrogenase [Proteobacteria bacterium]|nr:NADP-dependent phosphogluconate dehydrogenase [Pseudomonadota bacterium]
MKAGLVGLGVMGRNLALNLRDKGHEIFATDAWESARSWSAPGIPVLESHAELAATLGDERVILLMVKAGEQVDKEIADLMPHLVSGDIIIDGGNSLYTETERRAASLAAEGIGYLGCGISGGAAGARHGAAIMVGGAEADWEKARDLLVSFAATAGENEPTVEYFGTGGAGHFVKMVHNGIEYAIMQVIAECHALMRDCAQLTPEEISGHFERWSTKGDGAGFLLEITADIANARDPVTGGLLLPLIDDVAGQKGTGGWTVKAALETGMPATAIMEAVGARHVSGQRDARKVMRRAVGKRAAVTVSSDFVEALESSLAATMLVSVSQGLQIYASTAKVHGWRGNLPEVLRVWRAGSILRMRMLDGLANCLDGFPDVGDCLAVPEIARHLAWRLPAWREVATTAISAGVPAPVLTSTLSYVEALATDPLPTAVIQAQRDRFGAHGFRRSDRGGDHHGPWVQPDEEDSA